MMRSNVMIVVAVVSAILQVCSALFADEATTKPPGISIVGQMDDSLTLVVTDTDGHRLDMRLTRSKPDAPWRVENLTPGSAGIWFGNPNPTFAETARLRELGISPRQAVRTFTPSITTRPLDDLTIFRADDRDMVIALWRQQVITEIWYVGEMIDAFDMTAGAASACEQAVERCRRVTPIVPPPAQPPLSYPDPHIPSCLAVLASCDQGDVAAACDCLYQACVFCDMRAPHPVCVAVPGLEDLCAASCAIHVSLCNRGASNPNPDDKTLALLGEILNRVQVIIDIEQAVQNATAQPAAPAAAPE